MPAHASSLEHQGPSTARWNDHAWVLAWHENKQVKIQLNENMFSVRVLPKLNRKNPRKKKASTLQVSYFLPLIMLSYCCTLHCKANSVEDFFFFGTKGFSFSYRIKVISMIHLHFYTNRYLCLFKISMLLGYFIIYLRKIYFNEKNPNR